MSYSDNNETITVLEKSKSCICRSVGGRQETTMAKIATLLSFRYGNTHSDAQVSLAQTMNESDREEPMKEKVMRLPTYCCLEIKILLVKQFPEKISF